MRCNRSVRGLYIPAISTMYMHRPNQTWLMASTTNGTSHRAHIRSALAGIRPGLFSDSDVMCTLAVWCFDKTSLVSPPCAAATLLSDGHRPGLHTR